MAFDPKKSDFRTIEQAGNYLKSKENKDNVKEQIDGLIKSQPDPRMTQLSQARLLSVAIEELKDEGYELQYKKLLRLRLKGATLGQISLAIGKSIAFVKREEKLAMDCVKDKLGSRRIVPVV